MTIENPIVNATEVIIVAENVEPVEQPNTIVINVLKGILGFFVVILFLATIVLYLII